MDSNFYQRTIAWIVIFAMTINPAMAAQPDVPQLTQQHQRHQQALAQKRAAAGSQTAKHFSANRIVIDSSVTRALQAGIREASNGTTVIDIAAPSAGGVSHNQFIEFNVDQSGVIFNNSLAPVLTQLGGWADGNRRLTGGEASIILSEVTGMSRSQLLGQVEIAGKTAEFILANPNGITCNGCGFINTPRVTMVTGRPNISGGSLQGFAVSGGDFSLEGAGLNASNIDRFDIVTRAAQINAELYARNLNIFTGNNYFDYQTGQLAAQQGISGDSAYQFALDASSLGAMYANSIQLIGTEKGLGVNSEGLIHSISDLEISADGEIRLKNALANSQLNVTSHDSSINTTDKIYAQNVSLSAAQDIVNSGMLAAHQILELNAQTFFQEGNLYAGLTGDGSVTAAGSLYANIEQVFNNNGFTYIGSNFDLQSARLDNAGGKLLFHTLSDFDLPGELSNRDGVIRFEGPGANVTAMSIDNSEGSILLTSGEQLRLTATNKINNSLGLISSLTSIVLSADEILNHEGTIAADNVNFAATSVDNNAGLVDAQQLSIKGENLLNIDGQLLARGSQEQALSISIENKVDNTGGTIYSGAQALSLSVREIVNREGSISLADGGDLTLTAENMLDNAAGKIYAADVNLTAEDFTNNDGKVVADSLVITADTVANDAGHLQGKTIGVTADIYQSQGGVLLAHDTFADALRMDVKARLENSGGGIIESHGGDLRITTDDFDNSGGVIKLVSDGAIRIDAIDFVNHTGSIQANSELVVTSDQLNNVSGSLYAENIHITGKIIENTQGIIAGSNLILNAPSLHNQEGGIIATADLALQINELDNRSGLVQNAGSNFVLRAATVNNNAGEITHTGTGLLDLSITQLLNSTGTISGNGSIAVTGSSLHNSRGNISARQDINSDLREIDNAAGTLLAGNRLDISAANVKNNAGHIQGQQLIFNSSSLDNSSGTLVATAGGTLALDVADVIQNQQGKIISEGHLSMRSSGLNNDAGIVEGDTLALTFHNLSNRAGVIQGSELALTIPELNNAYGTIAALSHSGAGLQLAVTGLLDNTQGLLLSKGASLALEAAAINNQDGQILNTGVGVLRIEAGDLRNYAGAIHSNTDAHIEMTGIAALDNNEGSISARHNLNLLAKNGLSNRGGTLHAVDSLVVDAGHIDNADGLVSGDSLVLNATVIDNTGRGKIEGIEVILHADQLNNEGSLLVTGTGSKSLVLDLITLENSGRLETHSHDLLLNNINLRSDGGEIIHHGEGELRIYTDGTFDNRHGTLATQGQFVFDAKIIDNRAGQLIAGKKLDIAIEAIDNQGGLLQSGDGLSLVLDNFNNSDGGRVVVSGSSSASLQVNGELNNQQGSIIYWGDDVFTLSADALDNSLQGIIGGSGAIVLDVFQSINNSNGSIIGSSSVNIVADHIDNNTEGLIEAGSLLLVARQLDNGSGQLQAGEFLIDADTLTNAAGGKLLALGEQASTIDVETLSNAGEILANGSIQVNADLFTNQSGVVEGNQLNISVDTLDNSGLIRAGELTLQTTIIDNDGGAIAGNSLTLDTVTLSNIAGAISAQNSLLVSAQSIDNQSGVLQADQALNINTATIDNRINGLMLSNNITAINATSLDNRSGIIAADQLTVNAKTFDNRDGETIAEQLTLQLDDLDNSAGIMAATSTNTDSLTINIANQLINTEGLIYANGINGEINAQVLANEAGIIEFIGSGELHLTAMELNNTGGASIRSNHNLRLNSETVDNSDGSLVANSNVSIEADDVINHGGRIMAGEHLAVNAGSFSNNQSVEAPDWPGLVSANWVELTIGALTNNVGGRIEANTLQVNADVVDNHGLLLGMSVEGDALQLAVNSLNNSGNIESHGENLRFSDMELDNSGGSIAHFGNGSLTFELDELNNNGGIIDAGSALKLTISSLNNNSGIVIARGSQEADIHVETLSNSDGLLHAKNLSIFSTTLTNTLGEISGDQINITANQMTNSGGQVVGGELQLSTDQLNNALYADVHAYISAQRLTIDADELNNQSVIQAEKILLTGEVLNNTEGLILSTDNEGESLALNFSQSINNYHGHIESRGDSLLINSDLDNREGTVFMAGGGVLSLKNVDNTQGELLSNGHLIITADAISGFVNNQLGVIQAMQNLELTGAEIDNATGKIKAGAVLLVTADNVDNTQGLLLSAGTADNSLQLAIANRLINAQGVIETHADNFSLLTHNINNQEGEIRHLGVGTLAINSTEDFVNDQGTIVTAGDMAIAVEGTLTNDGNLVAARSIQVNAAAIENLAGRLIDATTITFNSETTTNHGRIQGDTIIFNGSALDNRSGQLLVSGLAHNSLQFNLLSVDNSSAGLIENHGGSLTLDVAFNNQGGRLLNLGEGVLRLTALSNQAGQVYSAGDLIIEQDTFDNSNGGLLQSAGELSLVAQTLSNRSGTIYTADALKIIADSLDNTGGGELLATDGFAVSAAQILDNTGGRMVALAQDMEIDSGLLLNNFGDIIHEGSGNLLLTGSNTLNNNAGHISTQGSLVLELDRLLNNSMLNSEGEEETAVIAARNFSLTATELQNNGGQIQASERLSLTLPEIDNQGGKIIALGTTEEALAIQTSEFDNSHGGLLQVHSADLDLSNFSFKNQGGIVNHQGSGNLIIAGQQSLQNAGGIVQSAGNIQISQTDIDNRSGLIYGRHVNLTAENLLNNSAGGRVAGDKLAVAADHINNTADGLLAGLGNSADALSFAANVLDNSGGTLRSGADSWSLNLDTILNEGGSILHTGNNQLALFSNSLLTTGGTIASTADLVIESDGLVNHGLLMADKNISLTSTANVTNSATGLIKGGQHLLLQSTGGLSNHGQVASSNALTLQLNGQLNNAGLIVADTGNATITANSFTNSGTLAYNGSGSLLINAGSALNNSGVLKSTGALNTTANSISNAHIISAGSLNMSGFTALTNSNSARIEAGTVLLQGNTFSNQGTLVVSSSGNSLALNVDTFNNSGTLASNSTDLSFMGNVTNSGTLMHAGSGVLTLGNAGSVNVHGGKISTAGTANLTGDMTGAGDLFARAGITIGGMGTFNNNGSKLYTQGSLAINSAVNNTQSGSMIADGVLTVNTTGTVNNATGHLQGSSIQINAGALTNSNGGRIVSTGAGSGSIIANTIDNSGGSIQSTNSIFSIAATQGDINNTGGKIHHQNSGRLQLDASGDVINSNTAEIISNGLLAIAADELLNAGRIQAGSFDITAQTATNSGLVLGTGAADSKIQVARLNNTGSIESSGNHLSIIAATTLDNTGGKIAHRGTGVLLLDAPSLFNASSDSSITGDGAIRLLTDGHFTNSGEISSHTLTEIKGLNALTNHGTIGSREGAVEIEVADTLTNTATISGKAKVDIAAVTLLNSGEVQSDNTVKLAMDALNITGTINAGQLLDINVRESINVGAGETISTAGSLILVTRGDVTNAGTIAAANELALGGQSLINNGNIEGGTTGTSSLDFNAGILNNNKISSDNNLTINAGSYTNNGSTAVAGNLVLAITGNITNNSNQVMFSGGDMTLGAGGSISNNSGTIFSIGAMTLAGENGAGANTAVTNVDGRIESLGAMAINTNHLTNTRTGVSYVQEPTTTEIVAHEPHYVYSAGMGSDDNGYQLSGQIQDHYIVTTQSTVFTASASGADAVIQSGSHMYIDTNSGAISNQYGTIASGADLTLNGGHLDLVAHVSQVHEKSTTITRRDYILSDQHSYCPLTGCTEYYDESDNTGHQWWGGTEETIETLGFALGTISAVGNISGNLSGELVTRIVDVNLGSLNQNTGNSGSGGSAHRGSGVGNTSSTTLTINDGSGQSQDTGGQSLAHNTGTHGSGANAADLTGLDMTLIPESGPLTFGGSVIDILNPDGTLKQDTDPQDANALNNAGEGSEAQHIAMNTVQHTTSHERTETEHTGPDYDAQQARDNAQTNAGGAIAVSEAGQLSGAHADSSQDALTAAGADNHLLASPGAREATDVETISADASATGAPLLNAVDVAQAQIPEQAQNTATPAEVSVSPSEPFAVDVAPGQVNPDNLGGLYVYNTAPNSNYLIETRPEFTDYTKFLGSDYLLRALGYDPEKTLKRLGDAFYENQLIRDALRSQANTRFLGNATSDEAHLKMLMDNAVDASQSLQLRVGIALSAAQVAALTQDIVWLVEQVVNGQTVLVPQLYLASADQNKLLPDGSLIAAGGMLNLHAEQGVTLEGTVSAGSHLQLTTASDFTQNGNLFSFGNVVLEADGAFTNNGDIQGDKVGVTAGGNLDNIGNIFVDTGLWLTAGDTLTNHSSGQVTSGGVLSLLSTNDLINKQGHLEGVDVFLKSETGNIVNRTEFEQVATQYGTHTVIGDSSTIISHNSLSMDAGNNLDLQGSKFNAANDISFTAGNDILLNAIENTRSSSVTGRTSIEHSNTTWDGVSIAAGNNLTMSAGRDIQAPGASLTAGNNASLSAGRDVNLLALANTNHLEISAKRKKVIDTEVVHTLASVSAGGNASITAGQDANLIGATVAAGGNVALHAERDTNLVAVNDSDYHYDYTKKKKSFGRSTTTENESLHTTSVGTMVTAGGNLTINALLDEEGNVGLKDSRNVFLQGSLLSAAGDVVVGAGENITVTANTEEHLDFQLKKKSGLGGITGKSRAETGADVVQIGSLIHSDKDVVMLAGNDLNIAGSTVNAGNNAELYAGLTNDDGDINIEARQHESFYESVSKKKSFSVDFSSDSVSFGKTNTKTQDNISVSNAASYVLAGGNITGDAARDITVTGSVLDAGETLQLESGRHITIQSGISSDSLGDEDKTKTAGVSWGGDDNSVSLFAGHETIGQRTQQDYEGVAGSHLAGKNVVLDAGSDINIIGSDVDAQRNINLTAGNDVNILASHESANISTRDTFTRDGLTLTANHNLGNAADAIGNIGGGDNAVSDASSVMKAMDAMNNIGPSGSAFLGQTTTTTTHQSLSDQARGSSLNAGEDVVINAGNNATVSGSSVNAGRNISVDANDIVITSAENRTTMNDTHEYDQVGATLSANQSGASLTIGFAQSESDHEQVIVTTTGSSLNAGQDISLNARNDLTIEGSDVNATRNIGLHAGNDVSIIAAQGHTRSTLDEEHLSGGAGIAFGADGIGFTAYVAAGENDLDRENLIHRNSTVSAGEGLTITSGNNADISGANLHAQNVDMDIGGDLTVASVQDTGSVEGRRWDASASITVGAGVSASVNVGYGETEGSSAWVTDQTSIIGSNSVNITVGGHTQVDGALIANIDEHGEDKGNLNLDTRTLAFTNLDDHNEETSSYLSVGIGVNGGSGHDTTQQKPNEGGKGSDGEGSGTSWSLSGSYYDRDQQQTTSATIGAGTITVREDAETGTDSTAGLNRDTRQSQVMTKDDETEIDLYVSSDSINAARGLFETDEDGNNVTLTRWKNNLTSLVDPDAYARIGANLHELSQVDGETLAQAWEQAKTTLGLVKVEVPDGSPMLAMIGEELGDGLMQQFENADDREVELSPDGLLHTVQIDGEVLWSSEAFIGEMADSLNDKVADAAFRDNLLNEEAFFYQQQDDLWTDIWNDTDDQFYTALGTSNAMYAGFGGGEDTTSLVEYAAWRGPQILASDAATENMVAAGMYVVELPGATVETVGTVGWNAYVMAVSGVAGIVTTPFEGGGADVVNYLLGSSYTPSLQGSHDMLGAVGSAFAPLDAGMRWMGDTTLDSTGSPLLATSAYMLPEVLSSIVAPGRSGVRASIRTVDDVPVTDPARLLEYKPGIEAGNDLMIHPYAGGGSHITTTNALNNYPESLTYGNPVSGLYLSPSNQIDNLLNRSVSRTGLEVNLGLNRGSLQNGDLVRIDVPDALNRNLRLPDPSTGNVHHRPGTGLTTGNLNEMVIDSPPKTDGAIIVTNPNFGKGE